jgi:hypothetical protein
MNGENRLRIGPEIGAVISDASITVRPDRFKLPYRKGSFSFIRPIIEGVRTNLILEKNP